MEEFDINKINEEKDLPVRESMANQIDYNKKPMGYGIWSQIPITEDPKDGYKEWIKNPNKSYNDLGHYTLKNERPIIALFDTDKFAVIDFSGFQDPVREFEREWADIEKQSDTNKNIGGFEFAHNHFDTTKVSRVYQDKKNPLIFGEWDLIGKTSTPDLTPGHRVIVDNIKISWSDALNKLDAILGQFLKSDNKPVTQADLPIEVQSLIKKQGSDPFRAWTAFVGYKPISGIKLKKERKVDQFKTNGIAFGLQRDTELTGILSSSSVFWWEKSVPSFKKLEEDKPFKVKQRTEPMHLPSEYKNSKGEIVELPKNVYSFIQISESEQQLIKTVKEFNRVIYKTRTKDNLEGTVIGEEHVTNFKNITRNERLKLEIIVAVDGDKLPTTMHRKELPRTDIQEALDNFISDTVNEQIKLWYPDEENNEENIHDDENFNKFNELMDQLSDEEMGEFSEDSITEGEDRKTRTRKSLDQGIPDQIIIAYKGKYPIQYASKGGHLDYTIDFFQENKQIKNLEHDPTGEKGWCWEFSETGFVFQGLDDDSKRLTFEEKTGEVEVWVKAVGVESNKLKIKIVDIKSIDLVNEEYVIERGKRKTVKLKVEIDDGKKVSIVKDESIALHWEASDVEYASVGSHGVVTGMKLGRSEIYVSDGLGNHQKTVLIEIIPSKTKTNNNPRLLLLGANCPLEICGNKNHYDDCTERDAVIWQKEIHIENNIFWLNTKSAMAKYIYKEAENNLKDFSLISYVINMWIELKSMKKISEGLSDSSINPDGSFPTKMLQMSLLQRDFVKHFKLFEDALS